MRPAHRTRGVGRPTARRRPGRRPRWCRHPGHAAPADHYLTQLCATWRTDSDVARHTRCATWTPTRHVGSGCATWTPTRHVGSWCATWTPTLLPVWEPPSKASACWSPVPHPARRSRGSTAKRMCARSRRTVGRGGRRHASTRQPGPPGERCWRLKSTPSRTPRARRDWGCESTSAQNRALWSRSTRCTTSWSRT